MREPTVEAVPRYHTPRNPNRETTGKRKAAISRRLGQPFMPWQRSLADVWGELDPATGLPWYRELLLIVLRQAGKTTFGRADMLDTCLYRPKSLVRYTAQNRQMALSRLEHDFHEPINSSPLRLFLNPRVGSAREGTPGLNKKTGSEYIGFVNKSRWTIDSVKASSGHGPALHKGCIDEAFAHPDGRVEAAMNPAMATVPDAQLLVMSAAGDSTAHYLKAKREAAIARYEAAIARGGTALTSGRTMFVEYSAPRDVDRSDPMVWQRTHPAIGHTIRLEDVAASHESMDSESEEFDRAYLGWWPGPKKLPSVVPDASWEDCGVDPDEAWDGEPLWSIDVAPDRDFAAIGMTAQAIDPGRSYGEVVKHYQGEGATTSIVSDLVTLRRLHGGNVVALDGTGAANNLARRLEAEGFEIRRLTGREKVDACGDWFDSVLDGNFAHVNDGVLNLALSGAKKRTVTDGGFIFMRNASQQDITPLYAVVVGRFAWVERAGDDYDPADSVH